jgi:hypothetical protein
MLKKRLLIVLFVIFPLLVGLACLGSQPDPTATPTEEPTEEITEEPTEEPTEEATKEPTEEPTEEATEEPTEEATEEQPAGDAGGDDLVMLEKSLWLQEEDTVFVAFFFENPTDQVFEDMEYTVYLWDANDEEIESDSSSIRWIFPNQTFGIAFNFYLDEGVTVSSASVDWEHESTFAPDGFTNPFGSEGVTYWENGGFPMVTGKITNVNTDTYTDIRVNVICYDAADEIIGGGYTYIDFVPGEDYMGFATYIDSFGEVASVEVFPTFSYLTVYYEGSEFWSEISILDDYFYEGEWGDIQGGAVVQNNTDTVLSDSILYATFYDADGNVTTVGSDYIDILLPGDSLGLSPWVFSPPDGAVTTQYDILVLPGDYEDGYELMENPFVVDDAVLTGDYNDEVLVTFTNNYSKSVSEVDVYVLLYDAEGKIIGGGSDWTEEPVAAGASAEINVWVDYSDDRTVDSIKVWVAPNYWTEFE